MLEAVFASGPLCPLMKWARSYESSYPVLSPVLESGGPDAVAASDAFVPACCVAERSWCQSSALRSVAVAVVAVVAAVAGEDGQTQRIAQSVPDSGSSQTYPIGGQG